LLPTSQCVSPYNVDETRLVSTALIALTTESGSIVFPNRFVVLYFVVSS